MGPWRVPATRLTLMATLFTAIVTVQSCVTKVANRGPSGVFAVGQVTEPMSFEVPLASLPPPPSIAQSSPPLRTFYGSAKYLIASGAIARDLPEIEDSFSGFLPPMGEISDDDVRRLEKSTSKMVLNLQSTFFADGEQGLAVRPDDEIEKGLAELKRKLAPAQGKLLALCVAEEPYRYWGITRTTLEKLVAKAKAAFPDVPVYAIFGQHCFDPGVGEGGCKSRVEGRDRGIPDNLDWVGFAWHSSSAGHCYGESVEGHWGTFQCRIRNGVERLKKLTGKPIVLTAEAIDLYIGDERELTRVFNSYESLMRKDPQIIGTNVYLWRNAGREFRGVAGIPGLRKRVLQAGALMKCVNGGACGPKSLTPPEGMFKIPTALHGEGFVGLHFDGTKLCGFRNEGEWMFRNDGRKVGDPGIAEYPFLPPLPYSGLCYQ